MTEGTTERSKLSVMDESDRKTVCLLAGDNDFSFSRGDAKEVDLRKETEERKHKKCHSLLDHNLY